MLKEAKEMKESDLAHEAYDGLVRVLREVPFLRHLTLRKERGRPESGADFTVSVRAPKLNRRLVCEVKPSGQPRIARMACLALLDYTRSDDRDYPVFIAPYISPDAAQICEDYSVGYLDLAGNARLAFDQVYIRREGYANPRVQKRDLRSLYSPKAERVLRVLMSAGRRSWRMQELAESAQVSLGQAANVKRLLENREWISVDEAGFQIRSFDSAVLPIIREWAASYRADRNSSLDFYSLKSVPQIEAELVETARSIKAQFALTGFSGAARLAPAVRYQRVSAYILGDIAALSERAGLKQVSSGANVTLIQPYDEGIFSGGRKVDAAPIVSPVQLYLDLQQTKGRGEEAATAILEGVIKPQWQ